jgi:sugar phosphate permease
VNYIKASAIAWIVYVALYLGRMNFAALIPIIRDTHGISNTQIGLIASTLFLAYTIFQIPSGILVDRFGIKYVVAAGCLLISIGNLMITSWMIPLMILAQFINGVGQSTGWSSLVKFTSKTRDRAKAIGILSSAVPAGTFLSFIFASFIAEKIGISYAFIFPAALLTLLAAVSISIFPADRSVDFSLGFVKNKNVAILSFTQFSVFFSMIGLLTWASTYFFDVFEINEFDAARLASLIPLAGIIGGIAGGYFSQYFGEKNTIGLNQLMAAILFTLAFFTRDLLFLLLILFLASVFFRFGAGATYALAVKTAGDAHSASISGFLTFVANIGGVISTALIGSIADSIGFQYVFGVFALLFSCSTLASFYLKE